MIITPTQLQSNFTTVYGPVQSWRYGRSLGIDPIGAVSTCSFNCVYCQLGDIQVCTAERRVFQSTEHITAELEQFQLWDTVDVVTLSGSGEPTLALNLEEIIQVAAMISHKPVAVLTNSTWLTDVSVRLALQNASHIAAKLDAVSDDALQRINRPCTAITLDQIRVGIAQLRSTYSGQLAIQTMVLAPWTEAQLQEYIALMQELQPDEVQLNAPRRPRPGDRQLDSRENHVCLSPALSDSVKRLHCVPRPVIRAIASQISQRTKIPVRYALTDF